MKRFFASDAESDMLIAEATKTFGLKIGDIINMAIKNQFLPITEPFRTEARFILQRHTEGALEAQEIKQSMTRGIRALGTRPVRDADRLQGFFARYHRPIKSLYKIYCIPIAELQFMFVQALFLYIEKRIIRIIGNPVMDDNCKMVAKFRAITL